VIIVLQYIVCACTRTQNATPHHVDITSILYVPVDIARDEESIQPLFEQRDLMSTGVASQYCGIIQIIGIRFGSTDVILRYQQRVKIIVDTDNGRQVILTNETATTLRSLPIVLDDVLDRVQRMLRPVMKIGANAGGNVVRHVAFRIRETVRL
jgi:hypothetical protein